MDAAKITQLKDTVLGKRYDLSVAFLSPAKMRQVTLRTKKKNKVSNVLAFPLSKTSGEILICKQAAKPFTIEYLFIHGLLHLKGFKHSVTMENEEYKLLTRFDYAKNSNRNRRRNTSNKSSHRAKS
ncbi:rRNA maturation RNAse YbeY [Candidatus Parcubacteria bacterium]|nr:rRNA maturation RNAse YbeY [Candidatus Parcubacteria bacterium]